jgi:hypothetical protein
MADRRARHHDMTQRQLAGKAAPARQTTIARVRGRRAVVECQG